MKDILVWIALGLLFIPVVLVLGYELARWVTKKARGKVEDVLKKVEKRE